MSLAILTSLIDALKIALLKFELSIGNVKQISQNLRWPRIAIFFFHVQQQILSKYLNWWRSVIIFASPLKNTWSAMTKKYIYTALIVMTLYQVQLSKGMSENVIRRA